MPTPVLIVCYLRPQNLDRILSEIVKSPRRTYIFLDKAPSHLAHVSKEIMLVVGRYSELLDLTTFQMESNLGVGVAVPYAVNEVLTIEQEVIVLEDDCIPNEYAWEYFDYFSKFLAGELVMVSARSARPNVKDDTSISTATYTTYPLINGWSTNRSGWIQINPLDHNVNLRDACLWLMNHPKKILVFCFFWAAVIRVRNGKLKAWDSFMAFKMLIGNLKSISPNQTCVTVLGVDEVASNTKVVGKASSDLYLAADTEAPSRKLDVSAFAQEETNRLVETGIYEIRQKNLMSPFFAVLGISQS